RRRGGGNDQPHPNHARGAGGHNCRRRRWHIARLGSRPGLCRKSADQERPRRARRRAGGRDASSRDRPVAARDWRTAGETFVSRSRRPHLWRRISGAIPDPEGRPMSSPDTPDLKARIAQAKELAEKSTPGPWEECGVSTDPHTISVRAVTGFRDNVECIVALADDKSDEFHQHSMDMEFIAAARSLVPALAQALAAQMAENERLAQFIEVCRDEERRAMNAALAESERIKDLDRRVAGAEREPSIKERTRQRESHLNAAFTPIGDAPLPYNPDERRVCDYLQEITKGAIGCGADPIGFLVASHR